MTSLQKAALVLELYPEDPTVPVPRSVLCELLDLAQQPRPLGEDVPLTPAQAARLSGYSTDHIRRMLATGRWPNAGSRHRPRILRHHLPCKGLTD